MSILTESHPGLTFEEFRDSTVFLLYYTYSCLCYGDVLEDVYKLKELVRMAIRGKLHIPSFLRFMEAASSFIHLAGGELSLTELSFYRSLCGTLPQEKHKSFARFIRKLIKKIDAWESEELLYSMFPSLFDELMIGFSQARKETGIRDSILSLYQMFFDNRPCDCPVVFVPEFRYGLLFDAASGGGQCGDLMGYESEREYLEILMVSRIIRGTGLSHVKTETKDQWKKKRPLAATADRIAVYMPDGVSVGETIMDPADIPFDKGLMDMRSKGELPFLLSSLPLLKEKGTMVAVLPGALLYREGKESMIRRYLINDLNCLDTVVLLPDQLFPSGGQKETMLYFKMDRDHEDVLFIDCSESGYPDEDILDRIRQSFLKREDSPGFCSCVNVKAIAGNDYNLNLPRYISRSVKDMVMDTEEKRKRIEEIDKELKSIDDMINMYRGALEL